jgi:phosphoribosylglycinamide formyltransferase-1
MQGLIRAIREGELNAEIVLVVSDRATAPVLERATLWNIPTTFLDPNGLTREAFDARVSESLEAAHVELVLMIGYMRIVSNAFVAQWRGRLLNVHPSLLPLFGGGMNRSVHEAVLASGMNETGCTIHHVTEDVDAGPILLQKRCPVLPGDTVDSLKDRVQALEQEAFVEVVRNWRTR